MICPMSSVQCHHVFRTFVAMKPAMSHLTCEREFICIHYGVCVLICISRMRPVSHSQHWVLLVVCTQQHAGCSRAFRTVGRVSTTIRKKILAEWKLSCPEKYFASSSWAKAVSQVPPVCLHLSTSVVQDVCPTVLTSVRADNLQVTEAHLVQGQAG